MKPSTWSGLLFLFGFMLAGCQPRPQPSWLTPVRTIAPEAFASPATMPFSPATASSKAAASPAAGLPTPPPLPFSPLKDGAYMYLPMKNVNLWGRWAGYYRLPQAPNILIFVAADNEYWDYPHNYSLGISFAFQVFGIAPSQIATPFPPYRTGVGMTAVTLHFIRGLRQIYLPPDKEPLLTPEIRKTILLFPDANGPRSYRTPVPNVFVSEENISLTFAHKTPLRGGELWHGKKTIDCIVELEMAPGFHLKGPLRLWVPIFYYNGPPP